MRRTLQFALPRTPSLLTTGAASGAYTLWTDVGPATVRLETGDGELAATAQGPGAEAALAAVPRTVGLDDSPETFVPGSGLLRDMHRRNLGLRLGSTGRVFDTLLPAIIGQRVTTDEAKRCYERLVVAAGEPAPGALGLLLPPRPAAIMELSLDDFHIIGIEQTRARVIREAAGRAARLEEVLRMAKEHAVRRLHAVKGVGPWTSAQVMGAAWGDRDAIPTGDFHLPNTVSWALAREPRGTDERMLELLEPYRPQRRRALLLVKLSGVHAPRYGPRTSQSIISRGGGY